MKQISAQSNNWLVVVLVVLLFCATAVATTRSEVMTLADDLSGSEEVQDLALNKLKSFPRAKVLPILRDALKEKEIDPDALRAIAALEMTELLPELTELAKKSTVWNLFFALNQLTSLDKGASSKKALAPIYRSRLGQRLPTPTRTAILDGLASWKEPLPSKTLEVLFQDRLNSVVESAVRVFLAAYSSYSKEEKTRLYQAAFLSRPAMARLDAFLAFGALSQAERDQFKGLVTGKLCDTQRDSSVKDACVKVAQTKDGGK